MLSAIGTEMICGVVLGFVAKDWADRILFVWIVGLVACVQLFFLLGAGGLKVYLRQFIFSTVAALPFSLMGGLIRVLFFT